MGRRLAIGTRSTLASTPAVPTSPTSACAALSRRPATRREKRPGSSSARRRCAARRRVTPNSILSATTASPCWSSTKRTASSGASPSSTITSATSNPPHVALGAAPPRTHFVATPGSYAYGAPDLRSPSRDFLPRHAAVTIAETGLVTRGTEYARLDTGHHLPLACLSPDPPHSPDIAAAAALYLGCPYLWAGKSFLGIDCSGLVQNAFRDIGVTVPRDTDMQRDTIGAHIPATAEADLRRGDLLYMPGHVLIHEGDGSVIHADGASMTVRREPLAGFIHKRGLAVAGFVVRRP